ncbi:MAG: aminotransferase class V-fold PLP-dependent enzyme [Solobacterium sp.]|nr:aminotransferase class V-fold PLP-dependent enzyme [Solobacterium sp.]
MNRFEEERKHFPAALTQAYLDTGSTGLVPDYVYEGIKRYMEGRVCRGGDADWGGKDTVQMIAETRKSLAGMLGCEAEDIALGSNTAQMLAIFIGGIDLRPGDNVLASEEMFCGQRYGWYYREQEGIEIRYIPTDHGKITLDMIRKYADERTRVVTLDMVENTTGYRIGAEEIGTWCHQNGIWFVSDAAQAAGAVPIDVKRMHIDFLAGNDYKWMMNFGGAGYAYVSEQLRNTLKQRTVGWMADTELFKAKKKLDSVTGAQKYEYGYPNVSGIYGIGQVARRYCELGAKNIEQYILSLNQYLEQKVSELPYVHFWSDYPLNNRCGIMILTLDDSCPVTNESLQKAGVAARVISGEMYGAKRAMRIAVHYYNNTEDLDRLIAILAG